MKFSEYISQQKELYNLFHTYIENTDDDTEDYLNLTNLIESQKYQQNKEDLETLLQLLIKISNNHHRMPNFFSKIERIITFLKNSIQQFLSNLEIFNIFESNKRLLLYIITQNLIIIDEPIFDLIFSKVELNGNRYCHFFMPEIKSFVKNEQILEFDPDNFEDYEEKRQKGENDKYICELIRIDSIENFVSYVNQTNYSLHQTIKRSIFETNSFLIENEPTLIEYAAFYGSIQIFQYLKLNNVELEPSLWLYAIHGGNPELIHILEESHIDSENSIFEDYLKEAIKCHHNDIAEYIKENLLNPSFSDLIQQKQSFREDFIDCVFNSYNFSYFSLNVQNDFEFYCLCRYNYSKLVNIWLEMEQLKIENKTISNFLFFK